MTWEEFLKIDFKGREMEVRWSDGARWRVGLLKCERDTKLPSLIHFLFSWRVVCMPQSACLQWSRKPGVLCFPGNEVTLAAAEGDAIVLFRGGRVESVIFPQSENLWRLSCPQVADER